VAATGRAVLVDARAHARATTGTSVPTNRAATTPSTTSTRRTGLRRRRDRPAGGVGGGPPAGGVTGYGVVDGAVLGVCSRWTTAVGGRSAVVDGAPGCAGRVVDAGHREGPGASARERTQARTRP